MSVVAHVRQNLDGTWATPQLLEEHLRGTSILSASFAEEFGSSEWGRIMGLLHDIGKGRNEWQEYIRRESGFEDATLENLHQKIKHAIYGAKLAEMRFEVKRGRIISYCIAGHHTGLPDWEWTDPITGSSPLNTQLKKIDESELQKVYPQYLKLIQEVKELNFPHKFSKGIDLSLWIRLLYSCLVDSDFLDTEHYMKLEVSEQRHGYQPLNELKAKFDSFINLLEENAEEKSYINNMRRQIRLICKEKAVLPTGIFSLTVPTGGGKTLSSMEFAIEHSVFHKKKRIIYVIPYTSIIEQNSEVFKKIFGSDQVVEHHSNFDEDDSNNRNRLSTENWDAPIIVTTTVQFFESLFSSKPSRCRKLHNIVNSVVVLDETQLIPIEFLEPILDSIEILSKHYNTTFVLSTATQPAFSEKSIGERAFKGLEKVQEIIPDTKSLDEKFKRVKIFLPDDWQTKTSWEELASRLNKYKQVLCIVSDRRSCRDLFSHMPSGTFHLSNLMCGEHKKNVIQTIKNKLSNCEEVRVVSTQLVEAGVDLDFPVVFRAMAGLDSIWQAAGRCNREGKMEKPGDVFVFNAPAKVREGMLKKSFETTKTMLSLRSGQEISNSIWHEFKKYYKELYQKSNSLDKKEILKLLTPSQKDLGICFATAGVKFKLIDDSDQKSILVPYKDSIKYISEIRKGKVNRDILRKLQRFSVNIYKNQFQKMLDSGQLEMLSDNIYTVASQKFYSETVGLFLNENLYDDEEYIK